MKQKKWLSFLLILVIILPLLTITPSAYSYDPTGLPIAPRPPVPQPVPESEPEPEPEPNYGPLSVTVSVDRTEARTAETLLFSASASGGKGKRKLALRIFRDGENVHYFPSGNTTSWEYSPEYPGIYHGQAVVSDESGKSKYAKTANITVTLNDEEEAARRNAPPGMGGGDGAENPKEYGHFLELETIHNITVVEGKDIRIPIIVKGDAVFVERLKNIKTRPDAVYALGLPEGFDVEFEVTSERVFPFIVYRHRPIKIPVYSSFFGPLKQYLDMLSEIEITANNWWRDNELEMPFNVRVFAECDHGTSTKYHRLTANTDFTLTLLRDKNRNGIADREEEERIEQPADIAFSDVPDVEMTEQFDEHGNLTATLPKIKIQVYNKKPATPPSNYHLYGHARHRPKGVDFEQIQEGKWPYYREKGPIYRFAGFPSDIKWLPGEIRRKIPLKVYALDNLENKADMTMLLTINKKSSGVNCADHELSIEPVPDFSMLELRKEPLATGRITVITNSEAPITMTMTYENTLQQRDGHTGCPVKLQTTGPTYNPDGSGPDGVRKVSAWELVYNLDYTHKWYKGKDDHSYFRITLCAKQGNKTAETKLAVTLLRTRSGTPVVLYFLPMENQTILEGEAIKPVKVKWSGPPISYENMKVNVKNIKLKISPNLSGIHYDDKTQTISGTPKISNWQDWETYRTFILTISGEGKVHNIEKRNERDLFITTNMAESSFKLTVYRNHSSYDRGFVPIADQDVMEGEPIKPVIIRGEPGPGVFEIKSVQGCPPGVEKGPGGYYEGTPVVGEWQEGQTFRAFTIEATGAVTPGSADGKRISSIFPSLPEHKMHFTITVNKKDKPGGMGDGIEEETATPPEESATLPEEEQAEKALPEESASPPEEAQTEEAPPEEAPQEQDIATPPVQEEQPPASDKPEKTPDTGKTEEKPKPDKARETPADAEKQKPPAADQTGDKQPGPEQTGGEAALQSPQEIYRNVTPEDFAADSQTFTDEQKGLPRLGVALYDGSADTADAYQGILVALLEEGYQLNENLILLVTNAQGSDKKAGEDVKLLAKMGCRPIITVGERMATAARKPLKGIPLIAAGVDDPLAAGFVDRKARPLGPVTGVINPPIFDELLLLAQRMQPDVDTAGMLHMLSPEAAKLRRKTAIDQGLGFEHGRMQVDSTFPVMSKKLFAKGIDFLILDPSVKPHENSSALKALTEACIEARVPLYGTSVRQGEGGVAAVILPDYLALGIHAGKLATEVLKGANIAELPFVQATETITQYNSRTLDAFGLKTPKSTLLEEDTDAGLEWTFPAGN